MTSLTSRAETALPKVALVGCGYWGRNLGRNLAALGTLASVCDHTEASAKAASKEHGVPFRSWPELLSDPDIVGIVIATPASTHASLAREALNADKDVFVEKPVALRVEDGEQIVRLAESRQRILMVGHLLQYHPVFLKLQEMVRGGSVGKLQYVSSSRLNLGKLRDNEDVLWSLAPHDISMILSLAGEEPDRVSGVGSNFLRDQIADMATVHLSFPSGSRAQVAVSWFHPFKEQRLVVAGDQGMMVFDDTEPWHSKLQHYPHEVKWTAGEPALKAAEARSVVVPADEPLKLECLHFLECIAERGNPRTDGYEGLRVLKVLRLASDSMA